MAGAYERPMRILVVIQDVAELNVTCAILGEIAQHRGIPIDLHRFWSPQLALQYMRLGYTVRTGLITTASTRNYRARGDPIIPDLIIADELINRMGTQFYRKTLGNEDIRNVPNYTLKTNSTRKIFLNSNNPLLPTEPADIRNPLTQRLTEAFDLFDDTMNNRQIDYEIQIPAVIYLSMQFPQE